VPLAGESHATEQGRKRACYLQMLSRSTSDLTSCVQGFHLCVQSNPCYRLFSGVGAFLLKRLNCGFLGWCSASHVRVSLKRCDTTSPWRLGAHGQAIAGWCAVAPCPGRGVSQRHAEASGRQVQSLHGCLAPQHAAKLVIAIVRER
jgi:hypothetical protein